MYRDVRKNRVMTERNAMCQEQTRSAVPVERGGACSLEPARRRSDVPSKSIFLAALLPLDHSIPEHISLMENVKPRVADTGVAGGVLQFWNLLSSSSPVPKPIPIVLNQLKVGTVVGYMQLGQRQVDLEVAFAGLAENAVKVVAQSIWSGRATPAQCSETGFSPGRSSAAGSKP